MKREIRTVEKETRTIVYDEGVRMEAYRFEGIVQPFPNHFHGHYVIGFVENGQRILSCRNREYAIGKGSILIFNPGDNHGCVQSDEGTLDYRGLNISKEVMLDLEEEITGRRELPGFSKNVLYDEEALLLLLSLLIRKYGKPFENDTPQCRQEIERACEYMEQHFPEHIYLDQICRYCGLSKSTLLRAFTKEKGITPYRYLETIRVNEAKRLLSEGAAPLKAALETGFADQSHFTNYFHQFIGLAPGIYREIFLEKDKSY